MNRNQKSLGRGKGKKVTPIASTEKNKKVKVKTIKKIRQTPVTEIPDKR